MFKTFPRLQNDDAGAGGGGDAAKAAADARAYVAPFVADPEGLKAMPDDKVIAYSGKLRAFNDKATSDAMSAAALRFDKRPDWLPEQFYDPEKKALRPDALVKSWKDTGTELKGLKAAKGAPPDKPEAYKLERPKDLPEHISTDEGDPTITGLRALCHKAGMSQERFTEFMGGYLELAKTLLPAVDVAAEIAKLGDNGPAVQGAVEAWGRGMVTDGRWSQEEFDEVIGLGQTATGLRALNKLREVYGGAPIPVNPGEGEGTALSATELYALVGTEKYNSDPAERERVKKLFEKHFGTAPAGSSPVVGVEVPKRKAA